MPVTSRPRIAIQSDPEIAETIEASLANVGSDDWLEVADPDGVAEVLALLTTDWQWAKLALRPARTNGSVICSFRQA
jgi:hypothetical protein